MIEKDKHMLTKEEVKERQNKAYCLNLLKALKTLNPDRLQWCNHPHRDALQILAKRSFIAELIEVEFKKTKTMFSLCLTEGVCDIERTQKENNQEKVSTAVVMNKENNRNKYFQKIFSVIEGATK